METLPVTSESPTVAAAVQALPALARCSCGHDRNHYMVSAEAKHTFWGWVLISLGISSKPIYMGFRCRNCRELIEETSDPALMGNYRV